MPPFLLRGSPSGREPRSVTFKSGALIPGVTYGFVSICSGKVRDTEPRRSQEPHDFVQGQVGGGSEGAAVHP